MIRLVLPLLLLAGCQPRLNRQPKVGTYEASEAFADGAGARALPTGTVPYGHSAERRLSLARGRELYAIHCTACHGFTGNGGLAGARGFLGIPSLNTDRARAAPAADIIKNGQGLMYAMGDRLAPAEIDAIARYLRVLQKSRHFPVEELSADDRRNLEGGTR